MAVAAKEQLFDYIEVFYNQQRLHSAIGSEPGRVREGCTAEAGGVVQLSTEPDHAQKLLEVANTARRLQASRRSGDLSERATASREQPG